MGSATKRARRSRLARPRFSRAWPSSSPLHHLPFTLCRAPRELRAEAQSRSPDDRSLRAAIFGPGCGRSWRAGVRGSACERWVPPGLRRRQRLRREGKASRGAGWRLDRASVTSSGPQSGAAPCRLLACQEARRGGARGWEWKGFTAGASPVGCAGLVCPHTGSGGRCAPLRCAPAGGGASACLPLAQGLASTRVSGPQGAGGSLIEHVNSSKSPSGMSTGTKGH